MTLPKKSRVESLLEWGYKHHFIVPGLMKNSFKARVANSPVFVDWKEGIKLTCIGNSHIDAAWLWRKEDTRRKKINVTFNRALHHMEMYPEFTYTQNQAVYYSWIKELYPDIWAGIKKRAKEGRWEVIGGDWVECDANIPCGESLIRQRMAGQRFYLEEFGFISEIAWADDVFGFPHAYPQILAKSGARYFYTNKFNYNEVNKFPYHTMIWKSPDNSSVMAYWMQHKNSWARWLKTFKELSVLVKDGEHVELNYMSDFTEVRTRFSDTPLPIIGNAYGEGDGGNGPTPVQVIEQLCWHNQGFSRLGTMKDLFALLEPYRDRLPSWNDELYLECHQGTLTSIHMIKENNRTTEVLLHAIEYLNVINAITGGIDYQPEIQELWKVCLFNHFHDVLPGSSIIEVYRDCAREYQALYSRIYEIRGEISSQVGSNAPIQGPASLDLVIVNDLSWSRHGIVTISLYMLMKDDPAPLDDSDFSAIDDAGRAYPCQVVNFPHHDANREFSAGLGTATGTNYMKRPDGTGDLEAFVHPAKPRYLWVLVPRECAIAAFESRLLKISWRKKGKPSAGTKLDSEQVHDNMIVLRNDVMKTEIDFITAKISSIVLAGHANAVVECGTILYDDPATKFDAWNIDSHYHEHPVELPPIEAHSIDNSGPVMTSVLLKTRPSTAGTVYYHRIYVVNGMKIVYHDICVNWQEDHKLLKYRVHPTFDADKVRCGMQYGSIIRATIPKNRFTDYKAKYEYPTQQWNSVAGDVECKHVLVTLLNRNKYGLFCKGSTMELSLLKAAKHEKWTSAATLDPDDPRPTLIDRGFHRLSVAIKIQGIEELESFDWYAGYEFNTPFSTLPVPRLPLLNLFILEGDTGSINIGAVKMLDAPPGGKNQHPDWYISTEGDHAWIVLRLAEYLGKNCEVRMHFNLAIHVMNCIELDLLERKKEIGARTGNDSFEIDARENEIVVHISPFEIKTIAVRLEKSE
nr:glycoside hydrolase family 38 C-terminal domain-containing protein [Candidatus Sigynarchaeota archaeon]